MRERRHQMGLQDIQLEGPLSQEAVYAKRPGNRRLFLGDRPGLREKVRVPPIHSNHSFYCNGTRLDA